MMERIENGKLIRKGLLFVVVCAVLNGVLLVYGEVLAKQLLPIYKHSFHKLTKHYQLRYIRVEAGTGVYFKALVSTSESRVLYGRSIPNGIGISSQMPIGHVFQGIIVGLSVFAMLLGRCLMRSVVAFGFLCGIFYGFIWLEGPLLLIGTIETLIYQNLFPGLMGSSLAINMMEFINGGGRMLFAICMPIIAVGLSTVMLGPIKSQVAKCFFNVIASRNLAGLKLNSVFR